MLAEEVVVERVQRLPVLDHDVVGDVDDVVDRAHPEGGQAVLHPLRRGADLHARDHRGDVAGAEIWVANLDRRLVLDGAARLLIVEAGLADGAAGERRDLAGDAQHGEAVGPVRRDLDVEDDVAEVAREGRAEGRVVGQHEDALVLVGQAQLALGADHAARLDAANLCRLQLRRMTAVRVDQVGADAGEGDLLPRGDVRRAADDGVRGAAHIDGGEAQPVGVGVRVDGRHAPDDDVVPALADDLDVVDLDARERQAVRQRARLLVNLDVGLEPG